MVEVRIKVKVRIRALFKVKHSLVVVKVRVQGARSCIVPMDLVTIIVLVQPLNTDNVCNLLPDQS